MITGCSWKDDLQTNLFSDVWEDHTTEINWFFSSNVLQEEAKSTFTDWVENFENKKSNFIRIEPTKEYTILSKAEALQNENNFFLLVKVVTAEMVQKDGDDYATNFFRIIKEGEPVMEKGIFLRGMHIEEKNKEGEYEYEKEEKFVLVNSQGVLQQFGTLSKKNLKEHENRHENDFFVSRQSQGKTIIAGINLSRNVDQYGFALERLQAIEVLQREIMGLLFNVCMKQKTVVPCY